MNVWFFIASNSPTGSGNLIFQLERDMNEPRNAPHLVMHFSGTEFRQIIISPPSVLRYSVAYRILFVPSVFFILRAFLLA